MSPTRRESCEARAVRELVRESLSEPIPAIDWERVESGVFAKIAASPAPAPSPGHGGLWSVGAVALAAAAAVALVASSMGSGARNESASRTNAAAPERAAIARDEAREPVRVGDVFESVDVPIGRELPGYASWTVAPGSRAEIVALGAAAHRDEQARPGAAVDRSLTLSLARGSIHAEVVHQDVGEVFAVEVGRTRVAVHGTSFTVSLEGDRVVVEVFHGSVAVGPTGYPGATQGWLLVGPEQASFSLDGARDAHWMQAGDVGTASTAPATASPTALVAMPNVSAAPVGASPAAHARPASAPVAQAPATVAAPVPPPQTLASSDVDPVLARIVAGVSSCYDKQLAESGGVRFTIDSSLSVVIAPEGSIRQATFHPPLSPTLMACAQNVVLGARFPHAVEVTQARVPLHLAPR